MADEENSLTEVPATNEEVADSTEAPPTGVEGKPEEQLVTEDTATPGETDNTANQGENTADVLPLEDEAAVAEPAEGEEKTQAETDVPVEGTTTGAEGNGEPEVKGEEGESQPPAEAEEGESRPPAAAEEGESQPPAAAEEGESQPPAATEEGESQSPAAAEEGESQPPAAVEVADQEDGQTQPQELSLDGVPPEDESPQTADGKETELGDQPPQGGAEQQPKEGEQPQKSTLGSEEQPKEGVEGEPVSPVPQADTFENGERTESPVAVGEKLSREPTPEKQPIEVSEEYPQAATPEQEVDKEEELEEYEEFEDDLELEEPLHDREELIKEYHEAMSKREALQQQNHQLQHKLADYFRKKKQDDQRQDMDKNVTDQEQRYLKYMANLEDLRRQDSDMRERTKLHIEEIRERCEDKQSRVDYETDRYGEFKKQIALNSINSRSGKPILPKDIETYLSNEAKKEAEVVHVRLENIKLKNKLKKKEQQLKSKEELAEGLHLIDFEQLKIENQTYNEKIEERNEELLKLRKKITGNVQVLTHLKEKLQFVQAENQVLKGDLRDVEGTVAIKRDILSRTKQARDALRIDNHRLRQNCGLLGNEPLLRDFEERKDESDELKSRLEKLKMEHAELTLNASSFRRKIEQARSGRV